MTTRACRELGGFDPDVRHRTNDSVTSLALVGAGEAVTLLPALVDPDPAKHPGIAVRAIADGSLYRTIFTATRTADDGRPSVRAMREGVRTAAARLVQR
jgi:DNA-binding transcriptional LysR family regulator